MERTTAKRWLFRTAPIVAAVLVCALLWGFMQQNRQLRGELKRMEGLLAVASLPMGAQFPPAYLVGATGEETELSAALGDAAILTFSTTSCPYCDEGLGAWDELRRRAAGANLRFVAVSLDDSESTRAYALARQLRWPLWAVRDGESKAALRIPNVPLTIVVARGGHLQRAWLGALTDAQVDEVWQTASAIQGLGPETGSTPEGGDP